MPGRLPMNTRMARFARAVSSVIAEVMREKGAENVFEVVKAIPDAAKIPYMTAYSAMYGRARPNLWVMRNIAGVLGVSLDWLCERAEGRMDRPNLKTVKDVFGEASPRGRGRKRKGRQKRGRS